MGADDGQNEALARPIYIGSEIYRRSTYGPKHPLAIPRVSTCTDLIGAMGWLDPAAYLASPMATDAQILRFHDAEYLAALQRAEATQTVSPEDRAQFRIGADGNPVYPQVFSRPATSAGGVMLAARLTASGGIVHCPGGGTHHGRADRASGFCYLNDPVLGIMTWLDQGLERIVYLDIDAHHGDGVQDAFENDDRVLTISVHEAGRWPFTGVAEDRAGGAARNFPVPQRLNDSEFAWLLEQAILPLIQAHRPQAIFLQAGADALEEDPLAKLSLSNNAHWRAVRVIRDLAPRLVVVGGGGYNPYTVGRCWAGIWATLNGFPVPDRTNAAAEAVLRGLVLQPRRRPRPAGALVHDAARRTPRRPGARRSETACRPRPEGHVTGMTRRSLIALLSTAVLLAPFGTRVFAQTGPQPDLPKEKLVVVTHDGKRHDFNVEMALSNAQQMTGLMFRQVVPADGGMLFDWGGERASQMWMKNTVSSLDMLFINTDGSIRAIAEHTVPQSLAVIDSGGPVRATLELAAGTAERLDIRVGDKVLQRIFGNAS